VQVAIIASYFIDVAHELLQKLDCVHSTFFIVFNSSQLSVVVSSACCRFLHWECSYVVSHLATWAWHRSR